MASQSKLKAISFLGFNPKGYSQTNYRSLAGELKTTRFFQEALVEFYPIDTLYVLLTPTAEFKIPEELSQSNWKMLEDSLAGRVDLQAIREIPENHNENDIWVIFDKITEHIEEGDRILFDITHGFRSLPVLALIAVSYLRVVRNVEIEGIVYGAFQSGKNEAPVVDLLPIVSLLEWTTATDQFIKTGNGKDLASLLKKVLPSNQELRDQPETRPIRTHLTKAAEAIESVSLALGITRPIETMEASCDLESRLRDALPTLEERAKPFTLLVDRIIEEQGQFALNEPKSRDVLATNLWLQLKMIDWYLAHDQIVQAVTLAREWIISVLVLRFDKPMFQLHGGRNDVELALNNATEIRKKEPRPVKNCSLDEDFEKLPGIDELTKTWSKMTELRNDIAHVGMNPGPSPAKKLRERAQKLYLELKAISNNFLPPITSPEANDSELEDS